MFRYRFLTKAVYDPRPLVGMEEINMPWWCTGVSYDCSYCPIVCYLPDDEPLTKYWDDAFEIEREAVTEIVYSSRFPKPEWISDGGANNGL